MSGIPLKGKYAQARALGYKSMFEVQGAEQLKKSGVDWKYEAIKIPYSINGKYKPDFKIETKKGKTLYLEFKGFLKYEDRRKLVAVKKCNPNVDLRLVFQNKISDKNKRWATKNGFLYAEKSIPKEWLK